MTVTAVTSWEGTPEAIENLVLGSKASAPVHKEMGAKNPRYGEQWRAAEWNPRFIRWSLRVMPLTVPSTMR